MKPVLFAENAQTTLPETLTTPATFHCPNCMMGATCSDCVMYSSDGYCRKYGGYEDPDHWACPWYYES